ncbi:hypothetical protein X736_11735 [Mesorhizobium sp. L2C089B000]|nr:hypothetical protein X736_11735 [Mesorhizobium sp. L2C089B000]
MPFGAMLRCGLDGPRLPGHDTGKVRGNSWRRARCMDEFFQAIARNLAFL